MKYEAAVQNHRKRALDNYISTNAALAIATEGRQLFSVSNTSDRPTGNALGSDWAESRFKHDSAVAIGNVNDNRQPQLEMSMAIGNSSRQGQWTAATGKGNRQWQ